MKNLTKACPKTNTETPVNTVTADVRNGLGFSVICHRLWSLSAESSLSPGRISLPKEKSPRHPGIWPGPVNVAAAASDLLTTGLFCNARLEPFYRGRHIISPFTLQVPCVHLAGSQLQLPSGLLVEMANWLSRLSLIGSQSVSPPDHKERTTS